VGGPKRFSVQRKMAIVARLLRGEPLDLVARRPTRGIGESSIASTSGARVDFRSDSPWQNAYLERLIGSIRRECLDHIIIFNEHHLRGVLSSYFQYYHNSRTHLSLDKDCPQTRPIHPPTAGKIIAFPEVRGLHYRYERRAA
jgi:transposase InsO family protein